ncbi:MAG: uridine diphosphate-N-acetylglucosamine-binding protein YvcK [Erysipelotrichaceae bacterium]|nr:uridine diphosphate-N-acetylglucosamine-binding protein YvcK [Erysipelotrichaceae bacterium]
MKNIVVIGGGHGLSTIMKGIRNIEGISFSAIVTVADDGGSTGRLRQRYTIPAMGDIRNVLVSLSECDPMLQDLMNYRFEGNDGQDISGHSLGNLILTALTNMTGSFSDAINLTGSLLQIKGEIIPSTYEYVTLFARMDDDTIVKGEANIPSRIHDISKVFYRHDVKANPKAVEAIEKADIIIYGIGSLYTSILPNTIIHGINRALRNSKAQKIYFANCMTQSNETYNYDLRKHVEALRNHNTDVDLVIMHNNKIPDDIILRYSKENSIEVVDNGDSGVEVRRFDLLKFDNNLVRHDSEKIGKVIESII